MWYLICLTIVCLFIFERLLRVPWVPWLHKKSVFVTGCDSGFGNALVKSLYGKGVFVFAGCFTKEGAKLLREETGERLKTVILDVSDTNSIQMAYDFVRSNLPENTVLWGVVNNAGIAGFGGPVEFMTRKDLMDVMNVNCFGMVEVARIFLPLIKESKGRIVNTASIAGLVGAPLMHPYLLSKFALRAFSEALRYEKSVWGIKVATICPGMFATNIVDVETYKVKIEAQWEKLDPAIKAEYGEAYKETVKEEISKDLMKRCAPDLSPVVEADEHALFARYPQKIYYPGKDAKIVKFLYDWLPFVLDKLMFYMAGATKPAALKP